ncbi:MAG: flagellar protein FlaG [Pseudomonadota bacterium]
MSAFSVTSYATSTPSSGPSGAPARSALPASDNTQSASAVAQTAPVVAIKPAKATEEKARLDEAVQTINQFLKPIASSVQFSVDEDSGRTLVKVIDTDTNSVLRQFPSKEALAISSELGKLQGLLLKDKA